MKTSDFIALFSMEPFESGVADLLNFHSQQQFVVFLFFILIQSDICDAINNLQTMQTFDIASKFWRLIREWIPNGFLDQSDYAIEMRKKKKKQIIIIK